MTQIRGIPAERVFLVQISDTPILDLDFMSWRQGHRTPPGQGDLPRNDFAAALRATGYDGVVSLECFSHALRSQPAEVVARDGFAALDALWSDAEPAPGTV